WALKPVRCDRVLDVGTWTGVYAFYLTRDPGCKAVALDIDAQRIETIRCIAGRLGRRELSSVCNDEKALMTLPADFSVVLGGGSTSVFPDLPRTIRICRGP